MKSSKKAFTLVELIIVIAIIAILAVTAFLVLSKWLGKSRDARRMNDLSVIDSAFQIYLTTNNTLPIPENQINVAISGQNILYQGVFAYNTKTSLGNLTNMPLDPSDNANYLYAINNTKTDYQLLGFMEQTSFVGNNVNAVDYLNRSIFTKGSKIGMFLSGDNTPLTASSLELNNNANSYKIIFDNKINYTGTGKQMGTIVGIYNKDVSRYDSSLILNLDMKTSVYSGSERVLKDFSSGGTNASCLSYTAGEPDITLWQKCNDANQYVSNDGVKFISGNMFMVSNGSAFDISLTTGGMTFCAWHKELGVGDQYRSNILRRYENDNGIGLNINQYDGVYVDVNADYGNSNHTYFGTPLLNNRIVSCGTRDKGSVKLYVNGKNVMLNGGYYKYNLSYTKPSVSSPLMIGSSSRNPDVGFFNGYMGSIHFYNRVLSDIEIQALYDVGKSN